MQRNAKLIRMSLRLRMRMNGSQWRAMCSVTTDRPFISDSILYVTTALRDNSPKNENKPQVVPNSENKQLTEATEFHSIFFFLTL